MAQVFTFKVTDPVGLYASPATELVDTVKKFQSHVRLTYDGKSVNLKSMMGVLSLGIPTKANLTVTIDGDDEEQACKTIKDKINDLKISSI